MLLWPQGTSRNTQLEINCHFYDIPRNQIAACLIVLDETDVDSSLTEALSAHVDLVLTDDRAVARAHAASAGSLGTKRVLGMSVEKSLSTHDVLKDY